MRAVALVSGGKDSCHAMWLAQRHGHEIVALANLLPARHQPDELNSFMYQTVGHQLVEAYATCMGLPLYRRHIQGSSAKQDMQYTRTEGDEVEDLYCLLAYVKESVPGVGAVTSGAIASDYQRLRVENVCTRLNLVSLAYLWHQPQKALLRSMIESGLHAIVIKVAALGLDPRKHLGKSIAQLEPHLLQLAELYGSHVCGEGGEYETLVLDSPVFTHAHVVLDASEVVYESDDSVAPVAYLRPTAFHTELKPSVHQAAVPPPPVLASTISVPLTAASPTASTASAGAGATAALLFMQDSLLRGSSPAAPSLSAVGALAAAAGGGAPGSAVGSSAGGVAPSPAAALPTSVPPALVLPHDGAGSLPASSSSAALVAGQVSVSSSALATSPTSAGATPPGGFLLAGAGLPGSATHVPPQNPPRRQSSFLLGGSGGSGAGTSFLRMSSNLRSRTGQFASLLLPAVHLVPDDYVPATAMATVREAGRQTMERRPGLCDVHLRLREQADYLQVTCWAELATKHQVLACEVTENDTMVALLDVVTAMQMHLGRLGLNLSHGIYVHLMLANMGHFAAANSVYCKVFPQVDPPSRTCMQLPLQHGIPVMVDMLLARAACQSLPTLTAGSLEQPLPSPHIASANTPRGSTVVAAAANHALTVAGQRLDRESLQQQPAEAPVSAMPGARDKRVMHVQSISSWAPSCIGPYSQATSYDGLIHGAGCIPLEPSSMTVLPRDAQQQVVCALRHVQSVAVALRSCVQRGALGLTVYYVSSIGPSGLAAVRDTVEGALLHGLPPPTHDHLFLGKGGYPVPGTDGDEDRGLGSHRSARSSGTGLQPRLHSTPPLLPPPGTRQDGDVGRPRLNGWRVAGDASQDEDQFNEEEQDEGKGSSGEGSEESDQGEPLDPYLRTPFIPHPVRSNVVYAAVPALPRGCLVEVQPLMLDCTWLDARRHLLSLSSSEDGDTPGPHASATATAAAVSHAQHLPSTSSGNGPAPATAGVAALHQAHAGVAEPAAEAVGPPPQPDGEGRPPKAPLTRPSAQSQQQQHYHHASAEHAEDSAGRRPGGGPLYGSRAGSVTGAGGSGAGSGAGHHSGGGLAHYLRHLQMLTPDSCHTSVCSSLDLESLSAGGAGPRAGEGGAPAERAGSGTLGGLEGDSAEGSWQSSRQGSQLLPAGLPAGGGVVRGATAGGGGPAGSSAAPTNVMVTTVHCKPFGVAKSLYHLPLDVFARPAVNQRLRAAIQGVLQTYGLAQQHVVQLRAWYDAKQVAAEAAAQLLSECEVGWHISWMPVQHVSTDVCHEGCAAVLELLAKQPSVP